MARLRKRYRTSAKKKESTSDRKTAAVTMTGFIKSGKLVSTTGKLIDVTSYKREKKSSQQSLQCPFYATVIRSFSRLEESDREIALDHWSGRPVDTIASARGLSRAKIENRLKTIEEKMFDTIAVTHKDEDHAVIGDFINSRFVYLLAEDGTLSAIIQHVPENAVKELSDPSWTESKNEKRAKLIDKEIDGKITPGEAAELKVLDEQMLAHRRKVAPLPLDGTRRLYDQVVKDAKRSSS